MGSNESCYGKQAAINREMLVTRIWEKEELICRHNQDTTRSGVRSTKYRANLEQFWNPGAPYHLLSHM